MIGNSDDETNFPNKLFLTNTQVANLCKAFASYLSTNIKLSKTQLSKDDTIRRISWQTSWSITINCIAFNEKCN